MAIHEKLDEKKIRTTIQESIRTVLIASGKVPQKIEEKIQQVTSTAKQLIKEAVVLTPKTFSLKTEYQSAVTKENHFKLYKGYVDSFNQISAKLDSVPRTDAENPNNSDYRRLKFDEQHNMNGVKLHELYFGNISDLKSEIRMDSLPYIRLSNNWGTFENWQFDFRACALAATEGWAITYYDPYKQRYFNTFIEKHTENVPLFGIPVIVVDTWHHAWFRDHIGDKANYVNATMRELAWNVIEARMSVAEMSNLHQLFAVEPVLDSNQIQVNDVASNVPPITKNQINQG